MRRVSPTGSARAMASAPAMFVVLGVDQLAGLGVEHHRAGIAGWLIDHRIAAKGDDRGRSSEPASPSALLSQSTTLVEVSLERLDERSTTITVAGEAAPVDQSGSASARMSSAMAAARSQMLAGRNTRVAAQQVAHERHQRNE